jgi:hypothetical protein
MLRERGGENIDLRQSPAEAGEEEAVGGGEQGEGRRLRPTELDLEGEARGEEVGADEALRSSRTGSAFGVWGRGEMPNGRIRPLIFQRQKSCPA